MGRMAESNADLVRRGWDAALRGDLDTVASMLAAGVSWHGGNPADPGSCHNRSEALRYMRRARRQGPLPEVTDVVEVGDKVVVTLRRPGAGGEEPTLVANVTTIREGKVVEMVHFESPAEALAAARSGA